MAGVWKRPLSPFERFMDQCRVDGGEILASYGLTINATTAISEDMFRTALTYLKSKVPTLRLVIREKDGELWFHETDQELNFKYLENGCFEEEYQKMLELRHDVYNGPLWSIVVIPTESDAEPDTKQGFPFQYYIVMGLYHVITDGFSTMKICNTLIKIISDLIGNIPINNDQTGIQVFGNELQSTYLEIARNMTSKLDVTKGDVYELYKPKSISALMLKYYPSNEKADGKTYTIFSSLTVPETTKLFELCKKHGVSVNSMMSAIFDLVIFEMVKAKCGKVTEPMFSSHMINMRRYRGNEANNTIGLQTDFIILIYDLELDRFGNFWNHSRKIHNLLHTKLQNKYSLKIVPLFYTDCEPNIIHETLDHLFANDYLTSNMGNIDCYFNEETPHVKLTDLQRSTSVEPPFSRQFNYHTLNGRLIYNTDYCCAVTTKHTMEVFMSRMKEVFDKILQMHTPVG